MLLFRGLQLRFNTLGIFTEIDALDEGFLDIRILFEFRNAIIHIIKEIIKGRFQLRLRQFATSGGSGFHGLDVGGVNSKGTLRQSKGHASWEVANKYSTALSLSDLEVADGGGLEVVEVSV